MYLTLAVVVIELSKPYSKTYTTINIVLDAHYSPFPHWLGSTINEAGETERVEKLVSAALKHADEISDEFYRSAAKDPDTCVGFCLGRPFCKRQCNQHFAGYILVKWDDL